MLDEADERKLAQLRERRAELLLLVLDLGAERGRGGLEEGHELRVVAAQQLRGRRRDDDEEEQLPRATEADEDNVWSAVRGAGEVASLVLVKWASLPQVTPTPNAAGLGLARQVAEALREASFLPLC